MKRRGRRAQGDEEEEHRLLSPRAESEEENRSDRTRRTKLGGEGRNTDSRCEGSQSREEKKQKRMKQEVPFSVSQSLQNP